MAPECSSLCSQEPTTCPCSQPGESSPHPISTTCHEEVVPSQQLLLNWFVCSQNWRTVYVVLVQMSNILTLLWKTNTHYTKMTHKVVHIYWDWTKSYVGNLAVTGMNNVSDLIKQWHIWLVFERYQIQISGPNHSSCQIIHGYPQYLQVSTLI
jgi:hypothetical protein